ASGRGATSVHVAGLLRLWGTGLEKPLGTHPRLPVLWTHPGPRRKCGQKHPMGRAGPSGSPGAGWGDEPRTRRPVGRAECQWLTWYGCSKMMAYAAPQSLLHELLTTFSTDSREHAYRATWVAMILGLSGCLWAAPEMLRLFYLHPLPRTIRETTEQW